MAVRLRLAELVSGVLPALNPGDLPAPVAHLSRFTPAKRSRLGATVLVAAVRSEPRFRAAVLTELRRRHAVAPDPSVEDPAGLAAVAVLAGRPEAEHLVAAVAERSAVAELTAQRDSAVRAQHRSQEQVRVLTEQLAAAAQAVSPTESDAAEVQRLRTRLREQGGRLRSAHDRLAELASGPADAEDALRAQLRQTVAERDRARADLQVERSRAVRAAQERDAAVAAAREARSADEVRLTLLLGTMDGVSAGLRSELGLTTGRPSLGPAPADRVAARAGVRVRTGGRVGTLTALERVLDLPSVHLVVDGYNVTKTGYPQLELAAQRDRLVRDLALLVARTGAEVTVVFDGAAVVATGGSVWARGVRVVFSAPGVIADDVVRELVRAEPAGRPVVVVSSDREVADSVLASGAHAVPSVLLLERLAR